MYKVPIELKIAIVLVGLFIGGICFVSGFGYGRGCATEEMQMQAKDLGYGDYFVNISGSDKEVEFQWIPKEVVVNNYWRERDKETDDGD